MLTLWDPPRFLPGCSQAVIVEPEIAVCRNYDYSPELWERVVYSSRFGDRQVIGNNDCLWGLIDGMNSDGLVISLSFGGRRGSGPGFAVSLVVRYLLEVASSTEQAREILARMPVAMAYNLTIVDADKNVDHSLCRARPGNGVQRVADRHQPPRRDPGQHRACRALCQRGTSNVPGRVGFRRARRGRIWSRPSCGRRCIRRTTGGRSAPSTPRCIGRPTGAVELCWPDRRWVRHFDDIDASFDVVLQPS